MLGSSTTLLFKSQGCAPRSSEMNRKKSEFYEASSLLENADFYRIQEDKMLEGKTGKLPVKVSVFRNPIEEMAATRRFFKQLSKFESEWIKGKADKDDELLNFYDEAKAGEPLQSKFFPGRT